MVLEEEEVKMNAFFKTTNCRRKNIYLQETDALSILVHDHAKNISYGPVRWGMGGAGDCPFTNCERAATVTTTGANFSNENLVYDFDCGLHFFPAEAFSPNVTLRYDSTLLLFNASGDAISLREAWCGHFRGEIVA